MKRYIGELLLKAFMAAMTVTSFFGVFITLVQSEIVWQTKIWIVIGVFSASFLMVFLVLFGRGRRKISDFNKIEINAMYGDILKVRRWRKKARKPVVVIHVNSAFDVDVEDELNIPNPNISVGTLHGQWVNRIINKKIMTIDELRERIEKAIEVAKLPVDKVLPNKPGNKINYEIGSTIFIETKNCTYMLFAFSEFDENNHVVEKTKSDYCNLISHLIDETSKCQGRDVYIPLMGIGFSKFVISPSDALDVIKGAALSKKTSLKSKINIVVPYNCAKRTSIYD